MSKYNKLNELAKNEANQVVDQTKSTFDTFVTGINLPSSLVKQSLIDTLTGKFKLDNYKDIIAGKRMVTGADLLAKLGNENPSWLASVATDIATDPLTYAGGSLFKGAVMGAKALGASRAVAPIAARGVVGAGIMAAGGGDAKDIATGALMGPLAGKGLETIGKSISKVGDKVINNYYESTRKNIFKVADDIAEKVGIKRPSVSESREIVKDASTKIKTYYEDALSSKQDITDELIKNTNLAADEATTTLYNTIAEAGGKTIKIRERALNTEINKRLRQARQANPLMKKKEVAKLHREIKNEVHSERLSIETAKANQKVGAKTLAQIDAIGDEALSKSIRDYVQNNRRLVEEYNKFWGTKQVPIDYHIADKMPSYGDDFLKQMEGELTEGFVKRSKRSFDISNLTPEQINYISAERYAKAFLNKQEKLASKILQIPSEKTGIGGIDRVEAMLNIYDKFTNHYMKPMHLLFTHSWLVNNYTDDIIKAWISNGEKVAFKTAASLGGKQYKEILELANPKRGYLKVKFNDEMVGLAHDAGVLDSNFFRSINEVAKDNYNILIAKHGKKKADAVMADLTNRSWFEKGADALVDILKEKVAPHGVAIEGTARLKTFEHTIENLLKSNPQLDTIVKEIGHREAYKNLIDYKNIVAKAKDITNDVFFDYNNVSLFEDKVMKRIFPYYTFFSRNLNYHLKSVFDNMSGVSKALKLKTNVGQSLTEEQKEKISEWLFKYDPKLLSEDDRGILKLAYMPTFSMTEAFNLIDDIEDIRPKVHPILKSTIEILTNKDWFLGKTLTVEGYNGKKPVFDQALIPKLLGANVERSPTDSLYTKDSVTAIALNLKQSLAPTPLLDNLAGFAYDIATGRRSAIDSLKQRLSPIKEREIKGTSTRLQKHFERKDKRQEMIDERIDKIKRNKVLREREEKRTGVKAQDQKPPKIESEKQKKLRIKREQYNENRRRAKSSKVENEKQKELREKRKKYIENRRKANEKK